MNRLPNLTQSIDRHLTDEQMFELLGQPDQATPTLRLHLTTCPDCRAELLTLGDSLANFRAAATGLAAAEISTPNQRRAAATRTNVFRRHAWAASFASAVAVLAISVSLLRPTPQPPADHGSTPAVTTQLVPAAESDDALLDGIQQDLSTSIPPSLEPLSVPAASSTNDSQN